MSDPGTDRPGFLNRLAKFFTSLAGVITAAALLGGAITGAVAFIRGGDNGEPSPTENVAADLAVLKVDRVVTYGDYRVRPGGHVGVNAKAEDPGNVFYLKARIEGFKRETLRLRWFTYDPSDQRRRGSGGEASAEALFKPEAPANAQVAQVWVKEPGRLIGRVWDSVPGVYFVRFELYSGDVLIASKDSPSFEVG